MTLKASPLLIAQVTDIHLLASVKEELLGLSTEKSFEAIVESLKERSPQPDLLLLTGDLSQDESVESYQRLQEKLKPLSIPSYWLPGNHDKPQVMQEILQETPISSDKAFQAGGWQFLLLDSTVAGEVHGYLSPKTLSWLESQLEKAQHCPTIISLHHPPLSVNSDWIDRTKLQNAEELFSIIDRYPQVRLVVFGHVHQEFDRWHRGVGYVASPSTSVQFKPNCDYFCLDDIEPGFRLLHLKPDGTFETQVERVTLTHTLNLAATGY